MKSLYYSLAEALYECPKRGQAIKARRMPPATKFIAMKRLVGHTLDRVVALAYEQHWWEPEHHPFDTDEIVQDAFQWVWYRYEPVPITPGGRNDLLKPVKVAARTLTRQMRAFELVPTKDARVQPRLARAMETSRGPVELTGVIDVLVDDGSVSLVDVKAGSYRSARQLSWYRWLLEGYGVVPARVGFWLPLKEEVEWRDQRRLPDIAPMVETAVERLETGDARATPGAHCGLCPLLSGCTEGIQHKHRCTVANEKLVLPTPGVHVVGFGNADRL